MKKVFKIVEALLLCILFASCEDILEENISDDTIRAISPKDNEIIEGNSVNFTWSSLDGADEYRVQVLQSDTEEIVIDSLLGVSFLVLPMNSGNYDWRVRGENFAYQTGYSFPESFVVESTDDLSFQKVFLNAPTDKFYTKNNTIILNWSSVAAATSYNLQVKKSIAGNSSVVLQENDITATNFSLEDTILDEDAQYVWGIQAINENSQTPQTTRKIMLDTTLPNQPTLTSPNDDATASFMVDFSWNLGSDSGEVQSPLESLLEISTQETFGTIITSYSIKDNTQQHTFDIAGKYFWRVSGTDAAGNEGPLSDTRVLTIE